MYRIGPAQRQQRPVLWPARDRQAVGCYTDDHLGVMDHLGIEKFMVMGFCIGGPFIWNLLRRAPDRIVAAVLAQPSGSRPEMRDLFYDNNMKVWGPSWSSAGPKITMEMVDKFLTKMYRNQPRLRLHGDTRLRAPGVRRR